MIIEILGTAYSSRYEPPYKNVSLEVLENVPSITLNEMNIKNTIYDYQPITGKIKKIKKPVDQHDEVIFCEKCDTFEHEYRIVGSRTRCLKCGCLFSTSLAYCPKCNTPKGHNNFRKVVSYKCDKCCELYKSELYGSYTTQEIIIGDENSLRELKIILHVTTPLTKKDLGKKIRAIGKIEYDDKTKEFSMETANYEFITLHDNEDTTFESSRDIPGYEEWRKNVLERDHECKICGGDKYLEAHHIYGYKEYPQLRTDVDNGITVCKFCHDKYHSYYGVKKITPVKFIEYVKRFGLK